MDIKQLGEIPISSELPAGEDIRYEPEYEELQHEIDKKASITSEGGIDWGEVVRLSTSILSQKSKNLLVASYLSVGLVKTSGLDGLGTGIHIYRGLIENFWDSLFPPKKRMKGRRNALEWWLEKILESLESLPDGTRLDKETKANLQKEINTIDSFLEKEMEDAPLLNQLRNRIDSIPLSDVSPPASAQPPESTPLETSKPQPATASLTPAAETTEIIGNQEPQKVLRQGLDTLRQASSLFRQEEPSNEMAYRLTRLAAWVNVDKPPPAKDGKTRIPPPMKEFTGALERLHEEGNFAELLESAEGRVSQFLFWLDLSRYSAEALESLGYEAAHKAVVEETARYVQRLQGVEKLAFSDGTPFADDATTEWLKDILKKEGASTEADFAPTGSAFGDPDRTAVDETYARAKALVKEKKLYEALSIFQECINGAGSQKLKLLGRMRLAQLMIAAKKTKLAIPHLLAILEDIDRHALEAWDPGLSLEALVQVYKVFKKQKDESIQQRAASVFDRIARLSPATAVKLGD